MAKKGKEPLLVGIQGLQGSGKTTMTSCLALLLEQAGYRVAVLSLDDLYLSRHARSIKAHHIHPLLQTRGVPGTHQVTLGLQVLHALKTGKTGVWLPRFDKLKDNPRPKSAWVYCPEAVDMILFEGWCLAVPPQDEQALEPPLNKLEAEEDSEGIWRHYVNRQLYDSYAGLFAGLDMLIVLQAPNFACVHSWRMRQEERLSRQAAGTGTNRQSMRRFIQHFERLSRHALKVMPTRADVVFYLDEQQGICWKSGVGKPCL